MTPDSETLPIGGVDLYVAAPEGAGEPLVLVHGGWTDHQTFGALVGPLARRFRVVRYDRRGHSRSGRGPGPAARRDDENDLAALIGALGDGPVHLAGTSYGASIALALAGRRPDLVRSVTAHEPALVDLVPVPELSAAMAAIQDRIASGDATGATREFFESAIQPGAWETVPEHVRRASIANAQTFLDLREDPDWAKLDVAAVARFPGPIVITYGDAALPWFPYVATSTAQLIGRPARLIAGAGHTPHHTHPEEFAAIIEGNADGANLRWAA